MPLANGRTSNFRANFIGRMVSWAESNRGQLEQILAEDCDVDLQKLAQFAIQHELPHAHRVAIWKLLLKVTSSLPEARKMITTHRKEEAEILIKSLCAMRLLTNWSTSMDKLDLSEMHPTEMDIVRMLHLGGKNPFFKFRDIYLDIGTQSQLMIARQMLILCEADWIDAYWLTKFFDEYITSIFTEDLLARTAEDIITRVRTNTEGTAQFFVNSDVTCLPLGLWLRSGVSSVLSQEPLFRLWDKVCSCTREGVISLLSSVIVGYLLKAASYIVANENERDLKRILEIHLPAEAGMSVVAWSLDHFSRSSRLLARRFD